MAKRTTTRYRCQDFISEKDILSERYQPRTSGVNEFDASGKRGSWRRGCSEFDL